MHPIHRRRPVIAQTAALCWLVTAAVGTSAADHTPEVVASPEVVAQFTRSVQPLLLNRCAAGACHGGPTSPPPRLQRPVSRSSIDRRTTLANLEAVLDAIGPDRDPQELVAMLARRHPAKAAPNAFLATPLAPQARVTLESWLAVVRGSERHVHSDPAVTQAAQWSETQPADRPNRLRSLLDAAANPPPLPPPQEPQGVIFGKDVPPEE
jgi:hypothetical protein